MAAKKTGAESKIAFVFFNCDENKSNSSMNIFFNQDIYRDLKTSRKELFTKVQREVADGRVFIEEIHHEDVKNAILNGDPTEATRWMKYGAIVSFPLI